MTTESPEQMLRRENNPHDDGRAQAAADLMASADIAAAEDRLAITSEALGLGRENYGDTHDPYGLGRSLGMILDDVANERPREFRPIMRQPLNVRFRRRLAQMVMDWAERVATFASDRIWK